MAKDIGSHLASSAHATIPRAPDRTPSSKFTTVDSWTQTRKGHAAQLCRQVYGGLPSTKVLTKSETQELKALGTFLMRTKADEAFALEFRLERRFGRAPNGFWSSEVGREQTKQIYIKVCLSKGRYVPNSELVDIVDLTVVDSGGQAHVIKGNSLRHRIRVDSGLRVKDMFVKLCDNGDLPSTWRRQSVTPTTNDGVELDSFSEVRWYEGLMVALSQLKQDERKKIDVKIHPLIGTSKWKSDFSVNDVFIEVLRHKIEDIMDPQNNDQANYSSYKNRHFDEYARQGLKVFLADPDLFADPDRMSGHYEMVIGAALGKKAYKLQINTASEMPPGYWHMPENRDKAIHSILAKTEKHKGRYPTIEGMKNHNFVGLLDFLGRHKRIDRQAEAVRVNTLFIPAAGSKVRQPTLDELLQVCKHHQGTLAKPQKTISLGSIANTFGIGSVVFLKKSFPNFLDILNKELPSLWSQMEKDGCATTAKSVTPTHAQIDLRATLTDFCVAYCILPKPELLGSEIIRAGRAAIHYGFYSLDENRDMVIDIIQSVKNVAPGRYPGNTAIANAGFKGLSSFFASPHGRDMDSQDEALRCNRLDFPQGSNRPRKPTRVELLSVCRHHSGTLLNSNGEITEETIEQTFGYLSYQRLGKWLGGEPSSILLKAMGS